jgi:hypothetical protein
MVKLEDYTLKQLRWIISQYNHTVLFKGYSKLNKLDLIQYLRKHPRLDVLELDEGLKFRVKTHPVIIDLKKKEVKPVKKEVKPVKKEVKPVKTQPVKTQPVKNEVKKIVKKVVKPVKTKPIKTVKSGLFPNINWNEKETKKVVEPVKNEEDDIKKEINEAIDKIIKTNGNNEELVQQEVSKFSKKYPKFIIKAKRKFDYSPLFVAEENLYDDNKPAKYNIRLEEKNKGVILSDEERERFRNSILLKDNNLYKVNFKVKKLQSGGGFQTHLITYLTLLTTNEIRKLLRFLSNYSRANKEDKKELLNDYKKSLLSIDTLQEPLIGTLIAGLMNALKDKSDASKSDASSNTVTTGLSGLTNAVKSRFKKLFTLKKSDDPTHLTSTNLTSTDIANLDDLTPEERQLRIEEAITPTKRGRKALKDEEKTPEEIEERRKRRLAEGKRPLGRPKKTIEDDPTIQGEGIKNFLTKNISNIKNKLKNITPKLLNSVKTILKYYIVYQIGVKIGIMKQMKQSLNLMLKDRQTILAISSEIQDKNLLNEILDKIEIRNPRMYQYLTTNII